MMKGLGQLMSGPSRFVSQVIAIVYSDKVKVKMLGKPDVLTYFYLSNLSENKLKDGLIQFQNSIGTELICIN